MESEHSALMDNTIINRSIDIPKMVADFQQKKIAVADNFCSSEFALEMHHWLNSLPDEKWYVSSYPETRSLLRTKSTLNIPKNQAFINFFRSVADEHYANGEYAFRFKRTRYVNDIPPDGPEKDLSTFLKSTYFLQLLSTVTQCQLSEMNGAFASCYENGDFLARHNDANNGVVGFVMYFTKNWQKNWGGEIEFMDRTTLIPQFTLNPGFNRLLLFSINGLPKWQHEVKMVSKDAVGKRLAYSGWFK